MNRTPISNAVLMREAARNSRRWQTYGARMGFSGVLMALLLIGMWVSITVATDMTSAETTELSWLGRTLFIVFTLMQTMLALIIAPLMVSRAIIEERTDKTIELMVLSPIRIRHLLMSKIMSQILSILLIIVGALPILGMVLSLGGVGVDEVVTITVGMAVTVVMMGALGAFFGMFTESPLIATVASLFWAIMLFLGLPLMHGLIGLSWPATAQVSPFFANVGNWWGLLVVLAYIPIVGLVFEITARMFELRVANAELRRYFAMKHWLGRPVLYVFLVLFFGGLVILPIAFGLNLWSATTFGGKPPTISQLMTMPDPGLQALAGGVGRGLSLIWTSLTGMLCTWVYLRLAMDMVDVFNGMLSGTGKNRSRKKRSVGHKIWSNPVLWRESRISGWGGGSIGMFVIWIGVMFIVFQTGLWFIPGGLLTLGVLNAVTAVGLAMWTASGSIEQERTRQTLDLLLLSRLSSWRILMGKACAAGVPTIPFLMIGCVLIAFGHPHLNIAFREDMTYAFGRGILAALWWIPIWFAFVHMAQWVGLKLRRRSSVYTMSLAIGSLSLGIPTFTAWILRDLWFVSLPARVVSAGMMPFAKFWELGVSFALWSCVALLLHVILVRNFRQWGGTVDG